MDTQILLTNCINQKSNAWRLFFNQYYGLITKSVNCKLNQLGIKFTKTERQDIVQEIFFQIWKKNSLQKIQDTSCLKNWLIITALNITSNYCKEKTYRNARNTVSLDTVTNLTPKPFILSLAEDYFDKKELHSILSKALSKLKTQKQLVLKLYFYNKKTYREIAEMLRIPKGTVATLINRTRKELKKILQGYL